jgi:hypothetical protein
MLATVYSEPQVVVNVNNIFSICPEDNCNYNISNDHTPTLLDYKVF